MAAAKSKQAKAPRVRQITKADKGATPNEATDKAIVMASGNGNDVAIKPPSSGLNVDAPAVKK